VARLQVGTNESRGPTEGGSNGASDLRTTLPEAQIEWNQIFSLETN
jgi:hypothetical protein